MTNRNANYNWSNISKEDVLHKYIQELIQIKEYAKQYDISESEINELFHETFHNNFKSRRSIMRVLSFICYVLKCVVFAILLLLVLYCFIINHKPTSSFIVRNAQVWIYPGFKIWRKLSLPVIRHIPSLTELYDESCLFHNPLFQAANADCWSCKQIKMIPDFSTLDLSSIPEYGQPYFVQTAQTEVTLSELSKFYEENKIVLIKDAPRIQSSNNSILSLDQMMKSFTVLDPEANFVWRINRMSAGRVLRMLFPRPYNIPNLGQSTERYIIILGSNSPPTHLPETDCFNVFVLQVSGYRNIILQPPVQCKFCKSISVIMKPSYVLVFNWLQYKAISLPNEMNKSESISFIGSYC